MVRGASQRAAAGVIALLACFSLFASAGGLASAQPAPEARLQTPPPGTWTVGFAWADSFSTLLASIPFEASSLAIFDNDTQQFSVYIPGAPTRVNADASAMLDVGSIIWVKRAESGALAGPPAGCDPVPTQLLALLDDRVGFGANTTGGAAGCIYHVTNGNDSGPGSLRDGARMGDRWIVFDGDFTIQLNGNINVRGNTTIDGRGRHVEVVGGGLHLEGAGASNVILTNLTVRDLRESNTDLLNVREGATDFWFDHLALVGATDEYIDISRAGPAGAYGTISWTHFRRGEGSDEFAILIGDNGGSETNHLIHVTLHHNWFNGTRQRNPSANGGRVHMFNNVIQWRLWGIQVRHNVGEIGAQVVSESDVFDATFVEPDSAREGLRFFDQGNAARVFNPLLMNGAGIREREPASVFLPSLLYDYTLDPVEFVLPIVTSQAGPRG